MLLMHVLRRVATSRCAYHIALRFPSNYVSWLNQGKYKENAKQYRKRMRKRDVAIRQKNEFFICIPQAFTECFSIMHGFILILLLWHRTKTLTKRVTQSLKHSAGGISRIFCWKSNPIQNWSAKRHFFDFYIRSFDKFKRYSSISIRRGKRISCCCGCCCCCCWRLTTKRST